MNLVIVESPAKAKTIEGFLGKDFKVKSSFGHVRDLAKKELSVDVDNGFEPKYKVLPDKKDVIKELKKLAEEAEIVWLATDEDREGEAISWHLFETLKLEESKTKRIVFNEITKNAILRAIENPREINRKLVDAQQARRVLDRLVGFELSPVLWKKVKPSLSAGRVQSVAVRLIVEREREIENFSATSFFKTVATFLNDQNESFQAEYDQKLSTSDEVEALLNKCVNAQFKVDSLETKPSKRTPAAPFTTSTLQQEASRKLGFSVSRTMVVAQQLYEAGKITYMRTDSVNLSDDALKSASEQITRVYGAEYSEQRKFSTKSKGAQEAHEAIRPTNLEHSEVEASVDGEKLYKLIWKRTIASQMSDAQLEKTTAKISGSTLENHFTARGEMIKFDGFLKVYKESTDSEGDEDQKSMLPKLTKDLSLNNEQIESVQRFTKHPPRYTEASLVKKLEENGIGRPSTYAPTISTIQKRGYVVKENRDGEQRAYEVLTLKNGDIKKEEKTEITGAEKSKLFPTDIGMVVNDYLVENFKKVLDYNFTAKVEKEFDEIAEGGMGWKDMISNFYEPFHETVEDAVENSESAKGERLLGVDPKTGQNVYVKIGKYGPIVQLGETDQEEKPKFASLHGDLSISNITLEQALSLLSLPLEIGEYKGEQILASIGRYGPYVKWKGKFYSLGKEADITKTELNEAIKIIEQKEEEARNRVINEFNTVDPPILILNGKYGPYINQGKKNYRIPKDKEPKALTLEECQEIINTPKKRAKKK